ncbi:peptidoglycan-binding protein [Planktothrix sp. FACHB-1365]|uniref:peptidoglycan-binding domain-containing protein n=1 Tax=Planktothrix sp. FACHB-1365 TaxID=2692855 RepID=UPI00168404E3|nr:peptidoglycan-binding protein [Planktothrix sp. FACHB-1365]MBD2483280.1 peptidoglycan-binding protein [Planktothrix sp. FACHB-1365]
MGIRTAIIAGLFSLVLPAFAPVAFATSNSSLGLTESWQEGSNSGFTSSVTDTEGARRELFSEPFYQVEPQPSRRRERVLSQGTEGSQVTGLQQHLKAHGFSPGKIDSVFGPRTTASVRAFQAAKGLEVTGVVDRNTWQALSAEPQISSPIQEESLLARGSRGSDVRILQERLEAKGYNPGPIDGILGSRTLTALHEFQTAQGLETSNSVNEATWTALNGTSLRQETPANLTEEKVISPEENSNLIQEETTDLGNNSEEEVFNLEGFTN